MERALRIVAPLAVHEESVMMLARREVQARAPNAAIGTFLQADRLLFPLREISRQRNARCFRRVEVEDLFFYGMIAIGCLLFHFFPGCGSQALRLRAWLFLLLIIHLQYPETRR